MIRPRPRLQVALLVASCTAAACSEIGTIEAAPEPDQVVVAGTAVSETTIPALDSEQPALADGAVDSEHGKHTNASGASDSDSVGGEVAASEGAPTTLVPSSQPTPTRGAPSSTVDTREYKGALGYMSLDQLLFGPIAPLPTLESGTSPLTGLPSNVNASAVVVKIDNSSKAAPQLGLNTADVVIEEQVEGGITRFAAVFHSAHTTVGPIRSGRTTDISFLGSLGEPSLVYSGANRVIDNLLLGLPNVNNYSAARSGGYWRDNSRPSVYDLMSTSSTFVTNDSAPPAWFEFDRTGAPAPGAPTSSVTVNFPNSTATWTWNGTSWLRNQNGRSHTTDGGAQVSATNVVVVTVPEVLTGLVDTARYPVPEYVWAGQGRAAMFIDGTRIDGTWTRSRLSEPAVFVGDDGAVVEFTPGNTWIELVAAGSFSSR